MRSISYRTYVLVFIVSLGSLLTLTALINMYFDPLLRFAAVRPGNRIVPVIDTRLQKTNRLLQASGSYTALLIGSSRVEQFRQQDFMPLRVFNYAAPSFYPDEAAGYLDLFLRTYRRKAVVVFLGLDFYGTNAHAYEHAKPPRYYIETSRGPFCTLKESLSRDTIKYSFHMLRHKKEMFTYDRLTLDKVTEHLDPAESDKLFKKQYDIYKQSFYGDYCYNESCAATLRTLRDSHPDVRFVVFTTPVTAKLFALLVRSGRLPDYERWLKDIVDVFGNVYNFMEIDRLTTEQRNFLDAHHLYPEQTAPLARIINGRPLPGDDGIGRLITRRNLASCIVEIRQQAQRLVQETPP